MRKYFCRVAGYRRDSGFSGKLPPYLFMKPFINPDKPVNDIKKSLFFF